MKLGENELGKVFVGDGFVEKMYQGDAEVYSIYKDPKAAEFTYRKTDNGEQVSVPDPYFGKALIGSIKGKTLVWNQLMKEISSTNYAATGNFSINNGVVTIVGKTLSSGLGYYETKNIIGSTHDFIAGHKYYIGITCTNYNITVGAATKIRFILGASANQVGVFVEITGVGRFANIMTCTNPYSVLSYGYAGRLTDETVAPEDSFSVKDLVLFDLTLMFGAGNEPSTVDEFRALFPLSYYDYNAGTLINNKAEALETVGFNQLVSQPVYFSHIPSFDKTTYTRVIKGLRYRLHHDALPVATWRHCYKAFDLNGVEIKSDLFVYNSSAPYYGSFNIWIDGSNRDVTEVDIEFACDCYIFVAFSAGAVTESTPMPNTCLNISNTEKNGTYEPYEKHTFNMSFISDIEDENGNKVASNGMKGVSDGCDILTKEAYTQNLIEVEFDGTETWSFAHNCFWVAISPLAKLFGSYQRGRGISSHFGSNTPAVGFPNSGTWDVTESNRLYFHRELVPSLASSTSAADWKAWLMAQKTAGTSLKVQYILASSIEIPLTDKNFPLQVKSHNIWDEEWERGSYNLTTGEPTVYTNNFRSKNPIKVTAGTYYMQTPYAAFVLSYDAEGNYLGYASIAANGGTFTPLSGTDYVLFTAGASGADYSNNICINVSSSFNGQYEPYGYDGKIYLKSSLRQVGDDGIVNVINGDKCTKKVGWVDMGTLHYYGSNGSFYALMSATGKKAPSNNIECTRYQTIAPTNATASNGICQRPGTSNEQYLNVFDHSFSDATSLQESLSGVILYFELETPVEYDYVKQDFKYEVDKNGTEKILPENSSEPTTAPFSGMIGYPK